MTDKRSSGQGHTTSRDNVAFMQSLEERFKAATGLQSRSFYKVFYGQVRPAPILTLGINPGGAPEAVSADGRTGKDGAVAAASAGYYEGDECDVLDCDWRENATLRPMLVALLGGDKAKIRAQVVKTNMAFRRSARKDDIDIDSAIAEAAPFLAEIIQRARANLHGSCQIALVIQVAHASQFGWTYDRYGIPQRILKLMEP